MPSLSDALRSAVGLEGYSTIAPPARTAPPSLDLEPGRNDVIRCPLPPLWQASPDSLRQFYVKGAVPQMRIMTPLPATSAAAGASGQSGAVLGTYIGALRGGGSGSTGSNGSSGGTGKSGGASTAAQAAITTPVLPPGNKFVGNIAIAKGFQLLRLVAGGACRVQLYGTGTAQSQDLGRALDVPPPAGTAQGIICDVVLDTSPYVWTFQNRMGNNADTPQKATAYLTVTNIGATSSPVAITMQYVPTET